MANLHSGQLFHPNNNSKGRFSEAATPERLLGRSVRQKWQSHVPYAGFWGLHHIDSCLLIGKAKPKGSKIQGVIHVKKIQGVIIVSSWMLQAIGSIILFMEHVRWEFVQFTVKQNKVLYCYARSGKCLYVHTTIPQRQRYAQAIVSHSLNDALPMAHIFLLAEPGHPPIPHRHAALHGVASDGACSIDVNLTICLWCARRLAACSATATPCSPNSYVDLAIFDSGKACAHVTGVT